MKLCRVLLSGLLITSSSVVSAHQDGVYYSEFRDLKKSPNTKMLFDEDLYGGSHTNQCNIDMYRPVVLQMDGIGFFAYLELMRQSFSLGTIQRKIVMSKNLSFMSTLLQVGLSVNDADLIIVTSETMPALYDYIDSTSKKAGISTPVVFVSLKKGFFKAFSRKICMFTGSVVIGQQLLDDLSDEELEAVVAQEIGHIKYNHSNKKFLLKAALVSGFIYLALGKEILKKNNFDPARINLEPLAIVLNLLNNKLIGMFAIPALSSLLVNKRFEKQVDTFTCKEAGKCNGLINLYERLKEKDQLRAEQFDAISDMIQKNAADIPMLNYIGLLMGYYIAKAECCVAGAYNKIAYPSHEERIAAAKEYLLQTA